ncbi:MAG: hypothetical protein ACTHKA_04070 [Anaerocolumna jejuensis]
MEKEKGIIPYSINQADGLILQHITCLKYLQAQQKSLNTRDLDNILYIVHLEDYKYTLISELFLSQRKCLLVAATMIIPSRYYLFQNLFDGLEDKETQAIYKGLEEISTYANIYLSSSSNKHMNICNRIIYLP